VRQDRLMSIGQQDTSFCITHFVLQVKVWFQNRRTKHKRVKLENGAVGSNAEEDKSPSTPMSMTGESIGSGEDEMEASGNDEAAS
jgi:hypothetical protein